MRGSAIQAFSTVHTEGLLLPPELLTRIAALDRNLPGLKPADYHLPKGERLNEAVNRAWNRLLGLWAAFQEALDELPEGDAATALTRERWLLPLFQELGYGRLQRQKAVEIAGRSYAVSHAWGHTPIHLIGARLDLDTRAPGQVGAAKASPYGLVQQLLNRSDEHLWAFVSNGRRLRLLRNNVSLTRQAYLEFDLAAMMEGELYADFRLLWLVCHQSRVESERPETCWLEKWSQLAREQGTRALEQLRGGVERAIEALGSGFLAHPANTLLRDRLGNGELDAQDYYRQLLRLVYRLIFLFVTEDRDLLLDPDADETAKQRYRDYYSTSRLRRLAAKLRGTRHDDLYQALGVVMTRLHQDGAPALGLPALGSFLWAPTTIGDLGALRIANRDLLEAVRALAFTRQGQALRPVDYRNMGSEELGSVYESLLELYPRVHKEAHAFQLETAPGHERKTTGSYYTPESLIQELLNSALDPVLDEAAAKDDPAQAILDLKVCDPAVGSGHFLVAAAHRIARRLATVRSGEEEPAPGEVRRALRQVVGHCLYGVDINAMAVELCKVSLWLEAMEPGKPFTFLDHHIRCGNSLLGATPELIAQGIPDAAYKAIEGDDKKVCSALKKRNKQEREGGQQDMLHLMVEGPAAEYSIIASHSRGIDYAPDDTPDQLWRKAEQFQTLLASAEFRHAQQVADAWCAAFVWSKCADAVTQITTDTLRRLEADPNALSAVQQHEVERLRGKYGFFHWHLMFPEVFGVQRGGEGYNERGDSTSHAYSPLSGFDCVLGNPPWERVKIQEKEWFAERSPEIAYAANAAARKRLIHALKASDPNLHQCFLNDLRKAEGESHLMRNSGRYPLCGRGDINLYTIFAEGMRNLLNKCGRTGCVLPTGIATDDTTKFFFQDVVEKKSLVSMFDFENKGVFFPGVHSSYKFCLFTAGRGIQPTAESALFVFFAHAVDELRDPERRFTLTLEDIELLNPNTRTCPTFRSGRDADLCLAVYRRHDVVRREGGDLSGTHCIRVTRMFDMNKQRDLFKTGEELRAEGLSFENGYYKGPDCRYVRLFEGKTFTLFDHRAAVPGVRTDSGIRTGTALPVTELQHADPSFLIQTVLYLDERLLDKWAEGRLTRKYLMGFMDVTSATNHRTMICTILPDAATDYSVRVVMPESHNASHIACLCGLLNGFAFDYLVRQKLQGLHLSDYITYQLALPSKQALSANSDFILPRVLELIYTAWDLAHFAQECGWSGPPFQWDEGRRFKLRCELDAAFFHLYLPADDSGRWCPAEKETAEEIARLKANFPTPRDAVAYVMDTFPIIRRKDEAQYGDYRTKETILEIYDAMQEASRLGKPYRTSLNPPPADPRCCHPPRAAEFDIPKVLRLAGIPEGEWSRPASNQIDDEIAVLAAVLKAVGAPAPEREVRLAALLAIEPRLLIPFLTSEEAIHWQRLVGLEAASLTAEVTKFQPSANHAWGNALKQLRATGRLIEDRVARTWGPGPGLDAIYTEGWPEGRVGMVLAVLRRRNADEIVQSLPESARDWIDARAA